MAGLGNQSSLPCESSNDENDVDNCSAKLVDLKALDCPICTDALTTPILQVTFLIFFNLNLNMLVNFSTLCLVKKTNFSTFVPKRSFATCFKKKNF